MFKDQIARIIYLVMKAAAEATGDFSQGEWEELPSELKDHLMMIVNSNYEKDTSLVDFHAEWIAQQEAEGWTRGPVLDVDNKISPYMVNFDDLPIEQRILASQARAIVHALRPSLPNKPPVQSVGPAGFDSHKSMGSV